MQLSNNLHAGGAGTEADNDLEFSRSATPAEARMILREIARITYVERNRPLIKEIAAELVRAGVDFSQARIALGGIDFTCTSKID